MKAWEEKVTRGEQNHGKRSPMGYWLKMKLTESKSIGNYHGNLPVKTQTFKCLFTHTLTQTHTCIHVRAHTHTHTHNILDIFFRLIVRSNMLFLFLPKHALAHRGAQKLKKPEHFKHCTMAQNRKTDSKNSRKITFPREGVSKRAYEWAQWSMRRSRVEQTNE